MALRALRAFVVNTIIQLSSDGRGHLPDGRIFFNIEAADRFHRSGLSNAANIIADHIDNHNIFGSILRRISQCLRLFPIIGKSESARKRPLHRARSDHAIFQFKKQLRRRRTNGELIRFNECAVSTLLRGSQIAKERKRIALKVGIEPERIIHLIGIPRRDVLLNRRNRIKIFIPRHGRFPLAKLI